MNVGTWLTLYSVQVLGPCNGATHIQKRPSLLGVGESPHEHAQVFVSCSKSSNVDDEDKWVYESEGFHGGINIFGWGKERTEELWFCTVRIQPGISPEESYCQEPKLSWTLSLLKSSKLRGFVMVALVMQYLYTEGDLKWAWRVWVLVWILSEYS